MAKNCGFGFFFLMARKNLPEATCGSWHLVLSLCILVKRAPLSSLKLPVRHWKTMVRSSPPSWAFSKWSRLRSFSLSSYVRYFNPVVLVALQQAPSRFSMYVLQVASATFKEIRSALHVGLSPCIFLLVAVCILSLSSIYLLFNQRR